MIESRKAQKFYLPKEKLKNGLGHRIVQGKDETRLSLFYLFIDNFEDKKQERFNYTNLNIDYKNKVIENVDYSINQYRTDINFLNLLKKNPCFEKTFFNGRFNYKIGEEGSLIMQNANFGEENIELNQNNLEKELRKSREYSHLPLKIKVEDEIGLIYTIPFLKMDGELNTFKFPVELQTNTVLEKIAKHY